MAIFMIHAPKCTEKGSTGRSASPMRKPRIFRPVLPDKDHFRSTAKDSEKGFKGRPSQVNRLVPGGGRPATVAAFDSVAYAFRRFRRPTNFEGLSTSITLQSTFVLSQKQLDNMGRADLALAFQGQPWVIELKIRGQDGEDGDDETAAEAAPSRIQERRHGDGFLSPVLLGSAVNDRERTIKVWKSKVGDPAQTPCRKQDVPA
jgi:hypothetical protein